MLFLLSANVYEADPDLTGLVWMTSGVTVRGDFIPVHPKDREAGGSRVVRVNDFIFDCGLGSVNLFQLLAWVKESKLLHKVWDDVLFDIVRPH